MSGCGHYAKAKLDNARISMTKAETQPYRPALHGVDALHEAGLIAPERAAEIRRVAQRYSVALTRTVADLIDPAIPNDPIARQFIPDPRELDGTSGELTDPIGDAAHAPVKGIVHRYPDRVLLTPLLTCPVYCRFCFRRERVGHEKALNADELATALAYIQAHPDIWEVILTGGDPLMLPAKRLKSMIDALGAIPHVRIIRIHSRVPVVDPGRITPAFVRSLVTEKALWLAVHANHPREFTERTSAALRRLARTGIPLVGQTVLLKGINDDPAILETLFRTMVENRIKPYYLHQADLAPGTAHFRTSIESGQDIMRRLRGRVSGLAQPTYVLDIPGGYGKAPIGPVYLDDGKIEDWNGKAHAYPPTGEP
jgi:lysine 2,3-aminomutase